MDRGREETRQDEEEAAPLIKNKGVGSHSLLMDAIQYQGWNLAEQRTSAVCKVFDVVEERKRRTRRRRRISRQRRSDKRQSSRRKMLTRKRRKR